MRLAGRLLLVLLLVAVTAAGGLWLWRLSLVDRLIAAELARRGFPDAEVAVVELELGRAVLAPARLGPDLTAARVVATYDPAGIASGALDGLVIEGLSVDLDRPGEGALGRLQALAQPAGGTEPDNATPAGGSAMPALPRVRLVDATVRATTPAGPVRLGLDATFAPQPDGPARLDADLRLESDYGRLSGTAAGTVDPAGPAASLALDIVGERLALGAAAVESVTVAARLDAGAAGLPELAADLVLAGVTLGEARFALVRADVRSFGAAVEATVHLPPPDGEAGMQLTLRRAADGALDARLFGDLARAPRLFALAGLPPPAGGSLAVFAEASLPATAPLPPPTEPRALAGWMQEHGAFLRLDVDAAALALPGLFGAAGFGLAAELPGPDGAAVLLPDGARVQVREAAPALLAALPDALRPLAGGAVDLALAPGARLVPTDDGWRLEARIDAGLRHGDERLALAGDLAATLPADGPAAVRLSGMGLDAALRDLPALVATGSAAWSGTAGSVAADLQLPDLALAADGVRLDATPAGDVVDATLAVASLRSTATPAAFPPAELAATARLQGGSVAFDGTARALAGRLAATLAGRHDLAAGTGSATVTVPPVALGPAGVDPAELLPAPAGMAAALGHRILGQQADDPFAADTTPGPERAGLGRGLMTIMAEVLGHRGPVRPKRERPTPGKMVVRRYAVGGGLGFGQENIAGNFMDHGRRIAHRLGDRCACPAESRADFAPLLASDAECCHGPPTPRDPKLRFSPCPTTRMPSLTSPFSTRSI